MTLALAAAVLLFLVCCGVFGYYYWRNKKRTSAESATLEDQAPVVEEFAEPQPNQIKQLEAKWKSGLQKLADSQLKQQGDPLYVLPWYVLLGRTGSGKSSAVRNSNVHMPFTELPPWSEIGPTANIDWWFLDPAVILDVTGRYTSGADSAENRQEWQRLVQLICSTRKNEPLNGVIITLPLEDLKTRSTEDLKEDAKKIRRRLDVLMDATGMDFPVYLMVSKCDLVDGFVDYFESVADKGREQILGALNRVRGQEISPLNYFEENFEQMVERLRRLRLSILSDAVDAPGVNKIFLLPESLAKLKEPLGVFIETLFAETQYETTPFFRGFFLASAKQEGEPFAGFPSMFSMENETAPQPLGTQSFFLADFFGKTLARDRELSGFSTKVRDWRKKAAIAALLAWSALWLVVCIQLTISFGLNWKIINQAAPKLESAEVKGNPIERALEWFQGKNLAVDQIYQGNRGSVLPRLGLNHSYDAEKKVRQKYVTEFRTQVLDPLDQALVKKAEELTSTPAPPAPKEPQKPVLADFRGKQDTIGQPLSPVKANEPEEAARKVGGSPEQTAKFIKFVLNRTAFLKQALTGDRESGLDDASPQPDYEFWLACALPENNPRLTHQLKDEYLGYLRWQEDPAAIHEEITFLTELLDKTLKNESLGLDWILGWANAQEEFNPITYKTFWNNDLSGLPGGDVVVDSAFTRKAWENGIKPMLDKLEKASSGSESVKTLISNFQILYWEKYQDSWEKFLGNFNAGLELWKTPASRIEAASEMLGPKSPFFQVIKVAGSELEPLTGNAPELLRPWGGLILNYNKLQSPDFQEAYLAWVKENKADGEAPGFFDRTVGQAKDLAKSALNQNFKATDEELEAISLWVDFEKNIRRVPHLLPDREKCYLAAKEAFSEGRATNASVNPILKSQWNIDRLKEIMSQGLLEESTFWNLFEWVIEFGWKTELEGAGEYLQKDWETNVLSEVTDLEGWSKMETLLYGENSKVWEFVGGPAEPFLEKSKDGGYAPKVLLDQQIPFSKGFLDMLSGAKKGRQQLSAGEGSMDVKLDARPTDVNRKARTGIERTTLRLSCGADVQVLEHFNFPVSKVFTWTPDKCRSLELEFEGGLASARKEYSGYLAFPQFLADISGGQKTYSVKELKKVHGDLLSRGVTSITAKFNTEGARPVLKFLESTPTEIPERIIQGNEKR